jgi:hypothetical protein
MLAALGGLMPALILAQEKGKVEPIKVVEIKRDGPVLYDKDIEPIFVNLQESDEGELSCRNRRFSE